MYIVYSCIFFFWGGGGHEKNMTTVSFRVLEGSGMVLGLVEEIDTK